MIRYDYRSVAPFLYLKLRPWIDSISDGKLRLEVAKSCYVAGGVFASLLSGENYNDIDIYINNKDTAFKLVEYYASKFKDLEVLTPDNCGSKRVPAGSEVILSTPNNRGSFKPEYTKDNPADDFDPVYFSESAITLKSGIQIVFKFIGEPEDVVAKFDFAHCKGYYIFGDNYAYISKTTLESILAWRLDYTRSDYPISSLWRTRKYIKRGWRCPAAVYLAIAFDIKALDLYDPLVLRDQLTGVDLAYYGCLISKLSSGSAEIDKLYIMRIIDDMANNTDFEFKFPTVEDGGSDTTEIPF